MAVDFFLARFKNKADNELQAIVVDVDYSADAKQAAKIILEERRVSGQVVERIEEVKSPQSQSLIQPKKKKRPVHPFNPTPYFKSLGFKDFLTILSVSTMMLAILLLARYFNYGPDLYIFIRIITVILMVFSFLLAHVLYKKDHNHSNNYIGRCINDIVLFSALTISITLYDLLVNNGSPPFFENLIDVFGFILVFSFLALILEGIVSLFKYLFRFLKWEVL
ncbi:MAG: hypothetical protein HEP71_25920 [Roseivirga sp.]|nr:hypothetical protein [Roseivirga sp.]